MNTTLSIILAAVIGFAVSALLGIVLVPWLHKLKFGQTILDIGPSWHKKKQGTPTMGGLMFIIATVVSMIAVVVTDRILGGNLIVGDSLNAGAEQTKIWAGLIMALAFGFIGFMDDYIKVVKKRNLGLSEKQKTVLQLIVAIAYLTSLTMSGNDYFYIPFIGSTTIFENEILATAFFWILGICVIYGAVNAVNFTDGVDGLCGSVTLTAAVAFIVVGYLRGTLGVSLGGAALVGACAGFLIWNWNPARVFMGDTGSMFLGGFIVALAFALNCPFILIPVGIIYIIEAMSVVIQRTYYKLTKDENGVGKRLFKMTPIHHSFEMSGWKEVKIVTVFSLINIIGCLVAIACFYFGR